MRKDLKQDTKVVVPQTVVGVRTLCITSVDKERLQILERKITTEICGRGRWKREYTNQEKPERLRSEEIISIINKTAY